MLQKEYSYIGYLIYATLFGGTVTGLSVGVLMPFRTIASLKQGLPMFQKKLALASATLFLALTLIVTVQMWRSVLILGGY